MNESPEQFEKRKGDHIRIALDDSSQTRGQSGLDQVTLIHEAIPEMDLKEVTTVTSFFCDSKEIQLSSPIFISSMTAGNDRGLEINRRLASLSERHQILMGVGSQRRELSDIKASNEWANIRKSNPKALLLGNLGLAQLITTPLDQVQKLVENLQAIGFFIHLNPLQEALQSEGTPNFKGGLAALENLVKNCSVPVIVKETGSGMSISTLKRLFDIGIKYVDISGKGGTHWGRVEASRSEVGSVLFDASEAFYDWGIPSVECVLNAKEAQPNCHVWASGGIRTGVDAAKMLALGADMAGMAQPFLKASLTSDESLEHAWQAMQKELQIAMFCTGIKKVRDFKSKKVWRWQKN
jgi:isopentenyl-diphosphate delta-isomerase